MAKLGHTSADHEHEIEGDEEVSETFIEIHRRLDTMEKGLATVIEGKTRSDSELRKMNTRMDAIQAQLQLIAISLPRNDSDSSVVSGEPSHQQRYVPIRRANQVPFSNPEHCRSERPATGLRENLIESIEMPTFEGKNAYSWMARAERFFRTGDFSEEDKLDWAYASMDGAALSWFNWEINRAMFTSWRQCKSKLVASFGGALSRGPSQSLFCLKQEGTVQEFVHQFKDLSSLVTGLNDRQLEGIFLNGLTPSMREMVLMLKPQILHEMISMAIAMEASTIQKHTGRPYRSPTFAEMDEKRRLGLCFKCGGRYYKGHDCPMEELPLITVVNGFVLEILEKNMVG